MPALTDLERRQVGGGGWVPPGRIETPPVLVWPPRPLKLLGWLLRFGGYLWPWNALFALVALLTWVYATPPMSVMRHFAPGWIAAIFVRNLLIVTTYVTVWHWQLYTRRVQNTEYKYNYQWPTQRNPRFLFDRQLPDNIFWTLASAVPIWTGYEVLTFWLQANGLIPNVSWQAHPVYCTFLMLLIPTLRDVHFYVVHRLIHWPPLYRTVHYLHHKNVNPGPWSGLAMHPVEHLLYFSGVALHWIIPSHPLHILFHLFHLALSPAVGHGGFHKVALIGRVPRLSTESYRHYLHHRYFEVNYGGDGIVPMDEWMGTFHDGSEQAQQAMRRRLSRRKQAARPVG